MSANATDSWAAMPERLTIEPGQVHLVRATAAEIRERFGDVTSLLSSDERARAARFVFERDRLTFTAFRALLRLTLGAVTGERPDRLGFAYGAEGKPRLEPEVGLEFNLSHTGELALLGLTRGLRIGVDVERLRDDLDIVAVGRTVFSRAELEALQALPDLAQRPAFFRLWARKEALIKAEGGGFTLPTTHFTLTLDSQPAILAHDTDPGFVERWRLWDVSAQGGTASAVAVESAGPCKLHRWRITANE